MCRCVPTYSTTVRRTRHMVLVELEVGVEDGRVQLHLAIELVADLFPVGGWLRHGRRLVMPRSEYLGRGGSEVMVMAIIHARAD